MSPVQAEELRAAIDELVKSACATATGVQIPKPGKVGHAVQCRRDLDVMITNLTDQDPS